MIQEDESMTACTHSFTSTHDGALSPADRGLRWELALGVLVKARSLSLSWHVYDP